MAKHLVRKHAPHDWVRRRFADGSYAAGCSGCAYIGLVGDKDAVDLAVANARLVAFMTADVAAMEAE